VPPRSTRPDSESEPGSAESAPGSRGQAERPVSLLALAASFARLGSTTFGGMWAATQALEAELVQRTRWLTRDDLHLLLLAANLIPAPRFIGFGGLVGYRLRGWQGSITAVLALIAPCALLVLAAVALVPSALLAGPLAPLQRAEGIAVVGLLFGNAYQQLRAPKLGGRTRLIGICLALFVALATIAGMPLLLAAVIGFAAGAVLIKAPVPTVRAGKADLEGPAS
jgi:chromate transporter